MLLTEHITYYCCLPLLYLLLLSYYYTLPSLPRHAFSFPFLAFRRRQRDMLFSRSSWKSSSAAQERAREDTYRGLLTESRHMLLLYYMLEERHYYYYGSEVITTPISVAFSLIPFSINVITLNISCLSALRHAVIVAATSLHRFHRPSYFIITSIEHHHCFKHLPHT